MHSNILQFDSHFAITFQSSYVKPGKKIRILNKETLEVEGEIANPNSGPLNASDERIYSLSNGWIIFEYSQYETYVFHPETRRATSEASQKGSLKKIEVQNIYCTAELPDGNVLLAESGTFFVYDQNWKLLKRAPTFSPGRCIVLNPETMVTRSRQFLRKYSLPGLREVGSVVGLSDPEEGRIWALEKVSDSIFLSGGTEPWVRMWNQDLKELKIFQTGEVNEEVHTIHLLPNGKVFVYAEDSSSTTGGYYQNAKFYLFPLGEIPTKVPKEVPVVKTSLVKWFRSVGKSAVLGITSYTYFPETQEWMFVNKGGEIEMKGSHGNEIGIFVINLNTLEVERLMDIPEDLLGIKRVKWPVSKADFECAVRDMRRFRMPVPLEILRVITGFLR